ncbi:DUF3052 domain-containing protein [Bacillus alkalicellulosilyticus]|uniref:DUF3052 domain-containing protein n=1 Tax=Alkalihalobacterium alkalicellulosilyticum TaxID=1912214 RepID=UPI000997DC60|nr:DUF3052 domain-containing protein [Bacillus alkalicellulosilyticus]
MTELHSVLKKLQIKKQESPFLILNAPKEYEEIKQAFVTPIHTEVIESVYPFIQIFGVSNEEIKTLADKAVEVLEDDGLLWLCYPKKSSKTYKGSNSSRDKVAELLADKGFEPVRQVAIDEDWSALRFRPVEKIKTMVRKKAVTEAGKKRVEQ